MDGLTVMELVTDTMDGAARVSGLVGLERPRVGRDVPWVFRRLWPIT